MQGQTHRRYQLFGLTVGSLVGAVVACSGDEDKNDDVPGSGGTLGAAGASGGGASGKGGAQNGVSGATGSSGAAGKGGAPGAGGSPGSGGASAGGAGGGATSGGAENAGGAAGAPPASGCRAPTPAADPGNECLGTPPPNVRYAELATGLGVLTFVTHAPGDGDRVFVVTRAGVIRVINDGTLETEPFLDISSKVENGGPVGEQGLLGLAFDPNYQDSGRFWVNYINRSGNGNSVVAEYASTPGGTADAGSEEILFTVTQPSPIGNHNGGMLAFGPDGCLYAGFGDGGGGGDPEGNGQDTSTELGAILRIDVDNYPTAAPGNMTGGNPHIWDYGLRNPWRFSFDRQTGDLYIGDVGQDAWEEVDVEAAGTGHKNYGWNVMEATHCYGGSGCNQDGKVNPVVEYENNDGESVTGGYVYRGSAMPSMVGRYLYSDYARRWIRTFVWSNGAEPICDEHELSRAAPGGVTSFGEDLAGEIYFTTYQGGVYRIEPE